MVQETGEVRLTAKQIEILRALPEAKLQAAFLLLCQVSPEVLNAKMRRTEEDDALHATGDPIRLAEMNLSKAIVAIHGPTEVWLSKSQIIALASLPTPHLRKALGLMKSVRQDDLDGLILHAQYGVTLENDELRRLMVGPATHDSGRHTSQKPAQQDDDDLEI